MGFQGERDRGCCCGGRVSALDFIMWHRDLITIILGVIPDKLFMAGESSQCYRCVWWRSGRMAVDGWGCGGVTFCGWNYGCLRLCVWRSGFATFWG